MNNQIPADERVWSADGSSFVFDSLTELLGSHDEIGVGGKVYCGKKNTPDPADFIYADDVIEQIACAGADVGHEWAEDYPDVTKEAIKELDDFLSAWARKHCAPNFFIVDEVEEYTVTKEDMEAWNE